MNGTNSPTEIKHKINQLKTEARVCMACNLSSTRKHVVFGNGDPQAKLMIVAEGPSATDDTTQLPFTGPAGNLLNDAFTKNGLRREEIWLTNIIKCRAATSDGPQLKNRPPKTSEIRACAKWLSSEISIITPHVILCMGSPSAKTMISKNFRLLEQRGIWFTDTGYAPFVSATYNPAFVLRMQENEFKQGYQTLIHDIAEAKQKLTENSCTSQQTLF